MAVFERVEAFSPGGDSAGGSSVVELLLGVHLLEEEQVSDGDGHGH